MRSERFKSVRSAKRVLVLYQHRDRNRKESLKVDHHAVLLLANIRNEGKYGVFVVCRAFAVFLDNDRR